MQHPLQLTAASVHGPKFKSLCDLYVTPHSAEQQPADPVHINLITELCSLCELEFFFLCVSGGELHPEGWLNPPPPPAHPASPRPEGFRHGPIEKEWLLFSVLLSLFFTCVRSVFPLSLSPVYLHVTPHSLSHLHTCVHTLHSCDKRFVESRDAGVTDSGCGSEVVQFAAVASFFFFSPLTCFLHCDTHEVSGAGKAC